MHVSSGFSVLMTRISRLSSLTRHSSSKISQCPSAQSRWNHLKISKLEDAQVFVIVNKIGDQLTGNFQGPLIINTLTKVGEQMVLADKRWTTRHPLMRVASTSTQTATA